MLENLLFSVNKVLPFILLLLSGGFLKNRRILEHDFFLSANSYVHKMALPASIFLNIYTARIDFAPFYRLLIFALVITTISFIVIWLVTELIFKDKEQIGAIVQGSFRGNSVLWMIPVAAAVVGEAAVLPATFVLIVLVPAYNIYSIIVLTLRGNRTAGINFKGIILDIAKNPIILSIFTAALLNVLNIRLFAPITDFIGMVGSTATPLGIMSLGGLFSLNAATQRLIPSIYAAAIKLFIQPLVFVPVAYAFGFRGYELFIIFLVLGTPAAISSYSMAQGLGGDTAIASNILILTTVLSVLSMSIGIYLFKSFKLI